MIPYTLVVSMPTYVTRAVISMLSTDDLLHLLHWISDELSKRIALRREVSEIELHQPPPSDVRTPSPPRD